jgi:hypothetical protein
MKCGFRIARAAGIVAGVFAFAALSLHIQALAQPAAVTLDPDLFKLPPPAPSVDLGKFGADKFGTGGSEFTLPNRIDLGSSMLRFDTSRSAIDDGPRVGIDNADPSLLNPRIPTRKDSPLTPNYFGLTFTAPTH